MWDMAGHVGVGRVGSVMGDVVDTCAEDVLSVNGVWSEGERRGVAVRCQWMTWTADLTC